MRLSAAFAMINSDPVTPVHDRQQDLLVQEDTQPGSYVLTVYEW